MTMKLSTLILSSATVLVAGAAFAADLPAKKVAPAAAPTGCSAFGAGYFQIPGGDTCIKFSGHAMYRGSYAHTTTSSTIAQGARARLAVDTASKTDLGTLTAGLRINGVATDANAGGAVSADRAWGQIGGFKFGMDDTHADIAGVGAAGTYAWRGGTNVGGNGTGVGMWYSQAVGAATIEVGEENAVASPVAPASASTPDFMLKATVPAGPISIMGMGISHGQKGYAALGNVTVKQGAFGAALFGGYSNGALAYTQDITMTTIKAMLDKDPADGSTSIGTNVGGELTYSFGASTAALFLGTSKATDSSLSTNTYSVNYLDATVEYAVAKNLYVAPEVLFQSGDLSTTTYYLTIHRDF
jgi:hypothetical protein